MALPPAANISVCRAIVDPGLLFGPPRPDPGPGGRHGAQGQGPRPSLKPAATASSPAPRKENARVFFEARPKTVMIDRSRWLSAPGQGSDHRRQWLRRSGEFAPALYRESNVELLLWCATLPSSPPFPRHDPRINPCCG